MVMMTSDSILSKRPNLWFTVTLFFFLKLFSSCIYNARQLHLLFRSVRAPKFAIGCVIRVLTFNYAEFVATQELLHSIL